MRFSLVFEVSSPVESISIRGFDRSLMGKSKGVVGGGSEVERLTDRRAACFNAQKHHRTEEGGVA